MARQVESFRPYLTGAEILTILDALENREDKNSMGVKAKLGLFKYKITHGLVSAAAVRPEKQSVAEKLGLAPVSTVAEKNAEVTRLAAELATKRDIMSSKEIFDSYFAKLGAGEMLTDEENTEAVRIELELYKANCFFFPRI